MLRKSRFAWTLGWLLALIPLAQAQSNGRIEGTITDANGNGIEGVTVLVRGGGQTKAELTDSSGSYTVGGLPAGAYTATFSIGSNTATEQVEVTAGATATLDRQYTWAVSRAETIVVYSASREAEKITEAPAAVTVVSDVQIQREAASGQVPKLLESTPGAEPTQNGLYDFNFNTRGFNSSLNRRVLVLIDGRDPAVPFLGSQDWAAAASLDDLAGAELVRGASSALYGGNAYNGVLNMTTQSPRLSQGGTVRASGGELSTGRLEFRYATELGRGWYLKATGGYVESDDFTESRNLEVEYSQACGVVETNCLPLEAIGLQRDRNEIAFGGLRFDRQFERTGHVLTFEGGTSTIDGPVALTGIGRVQQRDSRRPWGRIAYNAEHFNILAYYNGSDRDMVSLGAGVPLFLDSYNYQFEFQGNTTLWDGRARIVGGISYGEESIDSENPETGFQTLMFEPVDSDDRSAYGQMDINLTDRLKLVLAARVDGSSLHDTQFSPKGALVYQLADNHSLRFSYNEAFQRPNYSEFFLQVDVAEPIDLASTEALLAGLGRLQDGGSPVAPVLGSFPLYSGVRALGVGNEDLEVEKIQSFELGYTGIIGSKAFLTIDYYRNELSDFITDLITNVNPGFDGGRVNPNFGPHQAQSSLSSTDAATLDAGLSTLGTSIGEALADPNLIPELEGFFALIGDPDPAATALDTFVGLATLNALYPLLSNNLDESPIFGIVSYANFGEVDTQGVEVGLNYYFDDRWTLDFNYSWFDFSVNEQLIEDPLIPNAPEHKFGLGLSYVTPRWDVTARYRWSDDFQWAAGVFVGEVESYNTVNLAASVRFANRWKASIDVSNALDDNHYQAFGGDILERRALGSISYTW